MQRRRVVALFVALSQSPLVGCRGDTVGSAEDAATDVGDAAADSGAFDSGAGDSAASDSSAGDSDSGVGPNLLGDGTFDAGCGVWKDYASVISDESIGHAAPKSCRVCRLSDAYFFVAQSVSGSFKKGQKYQAKAWVRSADGKPIPEPVAFVIEGTDTGDVVVEYVKGAAQPVSSTWTEVQAVLDVKTDAAIRMHVRVGPGYASGSQCFVVDDASFVRIE